MKNSVNRGGGQLAAHPFQSARRVIITTSCPQHPQKESTSHETRRSILYKSATLAALVIAHPSVAAEEAPTSKAGGCTTIAQLINSAQPGDVVYIPGGTYRERLILEKPIELRAAPGQKVEVVWETEEHYESTLVCAHGVVIINGFTFRHASPSVANNYAVQISEGSRIKLENCDISSSTGSGVGIEGGKVEITDCRIHNCTSSGIMMFGDPYGGEGQATVRDCTIDNNKLHGIVVRQGAAPTITGNLIANNERYGLALQDCGGVVENNKFSGNKKGAVAYKLLDGIDIVEVAKRNGIEGTQLIETSL